MEFDLNGRTYRVGKMNAFTQGHVLRRLLPLVSAFGGSESLKTASAEDLFARLGPGLEAFARLPDPDVDFIVNACLAVVEAKIEGDRGWTKVSAGPGRLMFEDIDAMAMYVLAGRVLQHNLESFFSTARLLFQASQGS